jgi:tetratricopeptide (TPR) repeat protein
MLGHVLLAQEWDWAKAERELRRALELEPSAYNHWGYAGYLSAALRHDEALAQFQLAEERNPLLFALKWQAAYVYSCAGRHDEAIAELEQLRTRMGDNVPSLRIDLGHEYLASGRLAEGIAELEAAVDLNVGDPASLAGLGYGYARAGRIDDARALMPLQEQRSDRWLSFGPALYAALGETDRAIARVEASFDEGGKDWAPHFRCSWTYRELQNEPRFQKIMSRVGFPD